MSLRTHIYSLAKHLGGFRLASGLTRDALNILCYHGMSFTDEHQFRPKLFQSVAVFESRMRRLKSLGYRTLNLDEGLRKLADGTLERRDVVITVDDGFHGFHALAAPILERLGLSATIYVTTYYVIHNNPVYRLAVQYLFWKTPVTHLQLDDLLPGASGPRPVRGPEGKALMDQLMAHGETQLGEEARQDLLDELGRRMQVDTAELRASRRLTLMNADQIRDLSQRGFDIQLHTHRHWLPADDALATRELVDNRAVLEPLVGRPLHHLCYPSGEWSQAVWPSLNANAVHSATTCEPGLNTRATPPLALRRFLDFDDTPEIVFEAELSGFSSLLRKALGRA